MSLLPGCQKNNTKDNSINNSTDTSGELENGGSAIEDAIAVMGFSAGGIQAGEFLRHYGEDVSGTALDTDYKSDELDQLPAHLNLRKDMQISKQEEQEKQVQFLQTSVRIIIYNLHYALL